MTPAAIPITPIASTTPTPRAADAPRAKASAGDTASPSDAIVAPNTAVITASPNEPPTHCIACATPDAAPASSRATPARIVAFSGRKLHPAPIPIRISGTRIAVGSSLPALIRVSQATPARMKAIGCYGWAMKRVLVTGMSGTGKSATIHALASRGYKAVDADEPGWSEPVAAQPEPGVSWSDARTDWVWREDRIQDLLSDEDVDVLFVSGCATNQVKFYPQFDHIVLLTAPTPVMLERLTTRTTNGYGKEPVEVARIVHDTATVEPLLKRQASLEVDTSIPVERVVEAILDHVLA